MGLNRLSSGTSDIWKSPVSPNPDPFLFKLLKYEMINGYLIILVHYRGCTTFEGKKILVLHELDVSELLQLYKLDPHFIDSGHLIARFIPTKWGWEMAVKFCQSLLDVGE